MKREIDRLEWIRRDRKAGIELRGAVELADVMERESFRDAAEQRHRYRHVVSRIAFIPTSSILWMAALNSRTSVDVRQVADPHSAAVATLPFEGLKLSYTVHGSGPRVLVLTHGLLMNQGMYTHLAPEIARRGNRVVTLDLLGHGGSDQPRDPTAYSMPRFGRQVIALLDHLELPEAVVGGTSLGANVTLEAAVLAPDRVRAMVVEMPVLENALIAAGALFIPLALSIRLNGWGMNVLAAAARRVPRTHYLADVLLDWIRREPQVSLRVLEGLLFGRIAPPPAERRTLLQPALVIGHRNDPLHPFNDAEILTRELPHAQFVSAKSILEWRLAASRLDGILARFLDEVWQG